MTFVISSVPPLRTAATICSPISSGISSPCASAGLAEVQVSRVFAGSVSGADPPDERMRYGDPSALIVTGAMRSFAAWKLTVPVWIGSITLSWLQAVSMMVAVTKQHCRENVCASRWIAAKVSVRVLHTIGAVDAPTGDATRRDELERYPTPCIGEQRNPCAEEDRIHVQPNLVDEIRCEERPREITTAHHANPLPIPCPEVANDPRGVVAHELDTFRIDGRQRSREDESPHPRRHRPATSHLHRLIPGLPAHQDGVDRLPVLPHDLVDVLAHVQPVDLPILPGNESVERACCSIRHAPHGLLLCSRCPY